MALTKLRVLSEWVCDSEELCNDARAWPPVHLGCARCDTQRSFTSGCLVLFPTFFESHVDNFSVKNNVSRIQGFHCGKKDYQKKKKKPKQIIVFQGKEFGLRREYDFIFSMMETRYN